VSEDRRDACPAGKIDSRSGVSPDMKESLNLGVSNMIYKIDFIEILFDGFGVVQKNVYFN